MTKTYQLYQVAADRNTGEWLGAPEHVGAVDAAAWNAMQDTNAEHYDTYEEPTNDETRAIKVVWEE